MTIDAFSSRQGCKVWVFLGDSLTEGIGSQRVNYVSELMQLLRKRSNMPIHGLRWRLVNLNDYRDLSSYNSASLIDFDAEKTSSALWLVNLAVESCRVADELARVRKILALAPDRAFLLLGTHEAVARPSASLTGNWPSWLPKSWRHYHAMDPRPYFNSNPWRRAKQKFIDWAKQKARHALLKHGRQPLVADEVVFRQFAQLVTRIQSAGVAVTVLEMTPMGEDMYPGTLEIIRRRNEQIRQWCLARQVDFVEWEKALYEDRSTAFFRDQQHVNQDGARLMAKILMRYITTKKLLPISMVSS